MSINSQISHYKLQKQNNIIKWWDTNHKANQNKQYHSQKGKR